jgi:hypothetical protein
MKRYKIFRQLKRQKKKKENKLGVQSGGKELIISAGVNCNIVNSFYNFIEPQN